MKYKSLRKFFISILTNLMIISCLYMFRAICAHRQGVKIVLYSLWYHHTCRCLSLAQVESGPVQGPVQGTATYRCDDTRGCIVQF